LKKLFLRQSNLYGHVSRITRQLWDLAGLACLGGFGLGFVGSRFLGLF